MGSLPSLPGSPTLRLRLLGPLAVERDGQPLTSQLLAKAQALLAYLALTQQPQARAQLLVLLWGDSPQEAAQASLRQVLANLRAHVAPFVRIDRQTVALAADAPVWVDALAFEQQITHALAQQDRAGLEAALALYGGELLSGFAVRAAPDFERWMYGEQERLRALAIRGFETLAQMQAGVGQLEEAISQLRRVLALEPWREESHRALMALLARSGQRSAALAQYAACRQALADELNAEPSQETTTLYEQIQSGAIKQEAAAPALGYALAPATEAPSPTLVGRAAEWQQLQHAWQQASQGQAQLLLIGGEAGIGKTRLAEELVSWVRRQGGHVLSARCYAAEGELAFTPLIELLRHEGVLRTLPSLDEVWLAQVARLLPEVLAQHPQLRVPESSGDPLQRQRFFEALAQAVLGAGRPLLLLIDDVQWADRETLEWLHFLLRFAPQARLLVVGTVRGEEVLADHPLQPLLVSLHRVQRLSEIALGRLSEAETVALAEQAAGQAVTAEQGAALYQQTAGNPLFVVEMVRAQVDAGAGSEGLRLAASLPEGISAVIQARLAQLSPLAQEVAQLAAAAGRAFSLELLIQAGSYPEEELLASLDELWQRRILQEQEGSGYDFSHPRLRDMAYSQISPLRRRLLHRRIAQALQQLHAHAPGAINGLVALHYELGDQPVQAISAYLRAARFANQTYAHAEAAEVLRKALALLPAVTDAEERRRQELELQLALGHTLMMAKGFADHETQAAYEQARVLCQGDNSEEDLFETLWGLHQVYLFQCNRPGALEASRVCWELAQQRDDPERLLQAHHALWTVYLFFHAGPRGLQSAVDHARQGIALYRPEWHLTHIQRYGGHDPGVCARHVQAKALWQLGYPDQGLASVQDAVRLAREQHHRFDVTITLVEKAKMHACRGELDLLLAALAEAIQESGSQVYHGEIGLILRGWALGQRGRSTEGLELIQRGVAAWQAELEVPYILSLLAETQLLAGEIAAAQASLQTATARAQAHGQDHWRPEIYRLQAQCWLAAGNGDAAEASLHQALGLAQAQQTKSLELRAALDLSWLWAEQGRRTEAYALLQGIYSWFSEGFETADLRRADALLQALTR